MASTNNTTDKSVNQVLPGRSSSDAFSGAAQNFGINSAGFKALEDVVRELYGIRPIPTDINSLRTLFTNLGLYSAGRSNGVQTQPFVFSFQNLGAQFAGPAKFYTDNSKIDDQRWVLPVPPEKFSVDVPNSQQSINTVNGFTYTHAGNIELDEVSFEGFIPYIVGNNVPDYVPDYINMSSGVGPYRYHSPRGWVRNLVTAMRANQPLIFAVYQADLSGNIITDNGQMVISPTAMSVSSFNWNMGVDVGGSRRDVNYSITLKRWRRQEICISNYVAQPTIYGKYLLSSVSGKPYSIITVPAGGRTIRQISVDVLHQSSRWREIVKLNKRKLSNRGYRYKVPAGTRLRVPKQ